ncbi:hypothetical protein SADUNF_Sadunf10G0147600 [Salix dunnii]|uniref:Uncharacterized protein n=1 Tax=Salix dunnii TaxID=1413687 RepID=A0A835JRH2_9ROSI|nr:hypothetical protein SADUNF_Sadunf10G0147600 [Salix dunnii]
MANSRKQEFNEERVEQSYGNDLEDSSSISSAGETSTTGSGRVSAERSEPSEARLTERLTDILVDQGDGDLLLQSNDREDNVLRWLQALDMQVMGACRADERLKPLLKLNASSGVAEDRLLAHLSQHFEPSEVGMLARCFCIPLVSIRAGKINKQGTLLCPTTIRGDLNLTLLPASGLRLSFIGDDGNTERLFTLSSKTHCPAVEVHEIPADSSGRSFCLKISDGRVFYFWCSEKSKLLGIELLAKMKDILKRKPTIADLTGISKSRLDCFATHLRAYLVGSNGREISACSFATSSTPCSSDSTSTTNLSPRSSSFKEGLPRSMSSLRNAAREKLRRRKSQDNHLLAPSSVLESLEGCERDSETTYQDVDGIANRIATMGLVSLSESSIVNGGAEISGDCDNTIALPDKLPDGSSVLDGPYSDDEGEVIGLCGFSPLICWPKPALCANDLRLVRLHSFLPILRWIGLPLKGSVSCNSTSLARTIIEGCNIAHTDNRSIPLTEKFHEKSVLIMKRWRVCYYVPVAFAVDVAYGIPLMAPSINNVVIMSIADEHQNNLTSCIHNWLTIDRSLSLTDAALRTYAEHSSGEPLMSIHPPAHIVNSFWFENFFQTYSSDYTDKNESIQQDMACLTNTMYFFVFCCFDGVSIKALIRSMII